jgi:hypothetical protein
MQGKPTQFAQFAVQETLVIEIFELGRWFPDDVETGRQRN